MINLTNFSINDHITQTKEVSFISETGILGDINHLWQNMLNTLTMDMLMKLVFTCGSAL